MLTGIGSVNWNDPGMRQAAGLMTETADVLVHYQGGNDTGWTLTRPEGSYLFSLLPEGILHDGTVCVLGDGMVIDLDYLRHEISMMNYFHVRVTPENLKLSSRAAGRTGRSVLSRVRPYTAPRRHRLCLCGSDHPRRAYARRSAASGASGEPVPGAPALGGQKPFDDPDL